MSEELTLLKERATTMGISYSPNIGIEALKAKINDKLKADEPADPVVEEEPAAPVVAANAPAAPRKLTAAEALAKERQEQYETQMRLVRLRITNLNPVKKDLRGEIFTVANGIIGTVRKFIPYGEVTDNGFHVPFILFNELKDRKFVSVKVRKVPGGQDHIEQRLVPEFALEELPMLSQKELDQLARQQAAAAGME